MGLKDDRDPSWSDMARRRAR